MTPELRQKLISSRAERIKFLGNAVQLLESHGIIVTDEFVKRSMLDADDNRLVKVLKDEVAGVLLL